LRWWRLAATNDNRRCRVKASATITAAVKVIRVLTFLGSIRNSKKVHEIHYYIFSDHQTSSLFASRFVVLLAL
jgi:hypothetical protein